MHQSLAADWAWVGCARCRPPCLSPLSPVQAPVADQHTVVISRPGPRALQAHEACGLGPPTFCVLVATGWSCWLVRCWSTRRACWTWASTHCGSQRGMRWRVRWVTGGDRLLLLAHSRWPLYSDQPICQGETSLKHEGKGLRVSRGSLQASE